jgi:hypothetical protein
MMDYRRMMEEMAKIQRNVEVQCGVDYARTQDARADGIITTAIPSDFWSLSTGISAGPTPQAQHAAEMAAAREEGARVERERIMGKLEALKPMEQPYTRRDWALEQRGEQRLYERIIKAICGPVTRDSAGKE